VDSRVAFLIAAGAGALVLVPMGFRLMFAKSGHKQA